MHKAMQHEDPVMSDALMLTWASLRTERGITGVQTLSHAAERIHARIPESEVAKIGDTKNRQCQYIKAALVHMRHHRLLSLHKRSKKVRLTTKGIYATGTHKRRHTGRRHPMMAMHA